MKRPLLITMDFPPNVGGVAAYYAGLCGALPRRDALVLAPDVPSSSDGSFPEDKLPYGVIRRKFFWRWWPAWLPLLWHIVRTVHATKFSYRRGDVGGLASRQVASYYRIGELWVGQVLPVGTAVWLLKRLGILRLPYVVFTHGMDIMTPPKGSRRYRMMLRVLRGADRIVANSEFTKRAAMERGIAANKITVVHPGIALSESVDSVQAKMVQKESGLEGKRILLTVARLVKRKGIDCVLAALQKTTVDELVYVIVGDGPEKYKLETAAARDHLPVLFVGPQDAAALRIWYTLADVFILTPRTLAGDVEGFGMVYLEANAHGRPVIGTRSGGVPEAIVDGETGILVDEEDVDGIARAIDKLMTDAILRIHMGEQGLRRVQEQFQWERVVQVLQK